MRKFMVIRVSARGPINQKCIDSASFSRGAEQSWFIFQGNKIIRFQKQSRCRDKITARQTGGSNFCNNDEQHSPRVISADRVRTQFAQIIKVQHHWESRPWPISSIYVPRSILHRPFRRAFSHAYLDIHISNARTSVVYADTREISNAYVFFLSPCLRPFSRFVLLLAEKQRNHSASEDRTSETIGSLCVWPDKRAIIRGLVLRNCASETKERVAKRNKARNSVTQAYWRIFRNQRSHVEQRTI